MGETQSTQQMENEQILFQKNNQNKENIQKYNNEDKNSINCPETILNIAKTYFLQKNYKKAQQQVQKCLEINSEYSPAYFFQFLIAEKQQNLEKQQMFQLLEKTIKYQPDTYHVYAYCKWGEIRDFIEDTEKEYEEAVKLMEQKNKCCLKNEPEYRKYFSNLEYINILSRTGKNEKALKKLEELEKSESSTEEKYQIAYQSGLVYQRMSNNEQALKQFKKCLYYKPDFSEGYFQYGCALQQKGQYQKAVKCQQKVLKYDPQNKNAMINLGYNLTMTQQREKAIKIYTKCINYYPDCKEARLNLGLAYLQEDSEKSIEQFEKCIEIDEKFARAYLCLGKLYEQQEKTQLALQYYQKSVYINDNLKDLIGDSKIRDHVVKMAKIQKQQEVTLARVQIQVKSEKQSALFNKYFRKEINQEIMEFFNY